MQIDTQWMARCFDIYNRTYFDGSLPVPRFGVGRSRTRLGTMSCRRGGTLLHRRNYDFVIRLSNFYDQDEKDFQNVLLHEMIHLWIAASRLTDTSPHGRLFRSMATRINRLGGWHITVTSSAKGLKVHSSGSRSYLVLVMEDRTGSTFITRVSPTSAPKLERLLSHTSSIVSHQWLKTTDARFASFAAVRTLRALKVSRDDYEDVIRKATAGSKAL